MPTIGGGSADATGGSGALAGRSTLKCDGNDCATIRSITFGETPASASWIRTRLFSLNRDSLSTMAASTASDDTLALASVTSSWLNLAALEFCASLDACAMTSAGNTVSPSG